MPFPDSAQDGTRIMVVFGSEFTFFAIAHIKIPNLKYYETLSITDSHKIYLPLVHTAGHGFLLFR
jgi:hypothetical protein